MEKNMNATLSTIIVNGQRHFVNLTKLENTNWNALLPMYSERLEWDCITEDGDIVLRSNSMVTTHAQLENLRKVVIRKENNFSYYSIELNSDEIPNEVKVIKSPEMAVSRKGLLTIERKTTVVNGKRFETITKDSRYPFTKSLIDLDLNNLDQAHMILAYGVWVKFNGAKTKFFIDNGEELIDILTGDKFSRTEKKGKGWRHFVGNVYGPSKLRLGKIFLADDSRDNDAILDNLTLGGFELIKGSTCSYKEIVKYAARCSQKFTPSVALGSVSTWAMICGTFLDNFYDGFSIVNATSMAKWIGSRSGFVVDENATVGDYTQNRPHNTKQGSYSMDARLLKLYVESCEVVRFNDFDSISEEDAKEIWSGAKGKFAGKMVIIGSAELPDYITDTNSMKMKFDLSKTDDFDLLDIAKSSQGRFSRQLMEKIVAIDPVAAQELYRNIFQAFIDDSIDNQLFCRTAKVPTIKDVENMYLMNILPQIAPEYIFKDMAIFKSISDNMFKGMLHAVDKLGAPIVASKNGRLMPDIVPLFAAEGILKYGEIYDKDAERNFKKLGLPEECWTTTMIKYPSMGIREMYLATCVSIKTIRRRIKTLNVSSTLKSLLIEAYGSLSSGITVVPVSEELKQQCAGLDFDFDPCTLIYDVDFNAITHKTKNFIVNMIDDEYVPTKGKRHTPGKFTVSIKSFVDAFLLQYMNENKSIGSITHSNNTQIALLQNLDLARTTLKKFFGENSGSYIGFQPYFKLIDGEEVEMVDVNNIIINRVIDEISNADLTDDEVVRQILWDINIIYRYYQEKTIDSAKTGDSVAVKIDLATEVRAKSLNKISGDLNWEDGKVNFSLKKMAKRVEFDDIMNKMRVESAGLVRKAFTELIFPQPVYFESEDLAKFEKYADPLFKDVVTSLSEVKFIYNDLSAHMAQAFNDCETDEDKAIIRDEKKALFVHLSAMARKITESFPPAKRAAIMKYSAMKTAEGSRRDGGSQYAAILCPEEYLLMIIKGGWAELDFAGYELVTNKGYKAGDIVNFVHGIADMAIITEDISDKLTIREHDGKLFATKMIEDIISIPEATPHVAARMNGSVKGHEEEIAATIADASCVVLNAHGYDYTVVADGEVVGKLDGRGNGFKDIIDGATISNPQVVVAEIKDNQGRDRKSVIILGEVVGFETPAVEVPFEMGEVEESEAL